MELPMRTARFYLAAKAFSLCLMASPAYAAFADFGPTASSPAHAAAVSVRAA
jgi:hypothetical protein